MRWPQQHRALAAAIVVASALASGGCSDDDEPAGPQNGSSSTHFTGVFAGGTDGGRMDVTIMSASLAAPRPGGVVGSRVVAPGLCAGLDPGSRAGRADPTFVTALASLSPEGGSVANLTGTYDTVADTLNLAGGGYAMRGTRVGSPGSSELLGSVLGPNGTAGMRCAEGSTEIMSFCSGFSSGSKTLTGRLNFYVSGTEITGVAVVTNAINGAWIAGTATGTGATRNITFTGFFSGLSEFSGTGVLTVATGDVVGTWTLYNDLGDPIDSGTWSGSECLQGMTGPN